MSKVTHHPPGPNLNPLQLALAFKRDAIGLITGIFHTHGDLAYLKMPGRHVYLVNDAEIVKDVLVTNNHKFIKGRALQLFKRLLGNGLLASEGDFHRRQQKLMMPSFRKQQVEQYADVMLTLATRMDDSWHDGATVDMHHEMMKLTLQVAVKSLFNSDIDDDVREIGAALTVGMEMFERTAMPFAEKMEHWPLPSNRRFAKAKATIHAIIQRIIDEHRHRGEDTGDLLSALLKAQDEDGSHMTDAQLKDEVTTLFVAGHETTAVALFHTWYMLTQHPAVERKLHDELDAVLGGRPPTLADYERLPYTRMVFQEVLRLYPSVWALSREAIADYQIGPYFVPKGSSIAFFPYMLHRNPRYFDQPEKFDPDRWRPEAGEGRPRYAYIPFGGGARSCIGESFAWLEGVLTLAMLSQRWWVRLAPGQKLDTVSLLTLRPRRDLRMVLHARPQLAAAEAPAQPVAIAPAKAAGCPMHP
jgi:cytochrome P450